VTTPVSYVNTNASRLDDARIGVSVCDALDLATRLEGFGLHTLPVSHREIVGRAFPKIAERRRELAV
jgi:hypothetical protein